MTLVLVYKVLTIVNVYDSLLFLYVPTFLNNLLMCDRYGCQRNNIKNTKAIYECSCIKSLLKIVSYVKVCIAPYTCINFTLKSIMEIQCTSCQSLTECGDLDH